MKLRTRVGIVVMLLAALPSSLLTWNNYREDRSAIAASRDAALRGTASELADVLEANSARWLEGLRADARLPGFADFARQDAPPDPLLMSRYFTAVASRDVVNISAVGLLNLDGRVIDDSRALNRGRDELDQPYFRRLIETGQPQLAGPHAGPGGEQGIYLSALVRDADDKRLGVLRVRLEPSVVGLIMARSLVSSPELSATLLDEQGTILSSIGPRGSWEASTALLKSGVGSAGGERFASEKVQGTPWVVVVHEPLAQWLEPQDALGHAWWAQTLVLLTLLTAASAFIAHRLSSPIQRYSAAARRMSKGDFETPVPQHPGSEELRDLGEALASLSVQLHHTLGSLSRELDQRRKADEALRQSREQFLDLVEQLPCAVYRCANTAGWPMDYMSPQIQSITGFSPDALLHGDGQAFTRLILAEYIPGNEAAVQQALETGESYEIRYRIRHRNGSLRWIWERGSAHRDEAGQMTQLSGVLFDVTQEQATKGAIEVLRSGIDSQLGGDFFSALAKGLRQHLGCSAVMVGRFRGEPPERIRALALEEREVGLSRTEFELADTPSAALLASGQLNIADAASAMFPGDSELRARGIRGYVGRRLDDQQGRPIGVIAVLDDRRMDDLSSVGMLLDLCQARAAAELERVMASESLQHLAAELESRVIARTRELEETNQSLSQAMQQLVQSEKLASLGNLVAGVAHELNTPIGNALTVATALRDMQKQFSHQVAEGTLKRSSLERFFAENEEAASLVERNLSRAASLISQFKQVAVDQASVRRRKFDLRETINDVLSTLSPRLKRLPHRLDVQVAEGVLLDSFPGPLEQVLTNLIENSLVHAFTPGQVGHIRITATKTATRIRLQYQDDGVGIPAAVRHRVFDPFFTTRLGQGGSGLGLYLVYALVTGPLGGSICIVDQTQAGTCFDLDFPDSAPRTSEETE
jgi:PAS domain S-box-containing protein